MQNALTVNLAADDWDGREAVNSKVQGVGDRPGGHEGPSLAGDQERGGATEMVKRRLDLLAAPAQGRPKQAGPAAKTTFHGRVSFEPVRLLRDLGDIADAIVAQLGRPTPT